MGERAYLFNNITFKSISKLFRVHLKHGNIYHINYRLLVALLHPNT